jgi:hypothetical protein
MIDEGAAGVRESHAARTPIYQGRTSALLERGDLLRDRRLGVGKCLGRSRERSMLGDRSQDA